MANDIQQKDLVLSPNEYAYLLDKTKGIVSCYVGPIKTSLSNTDSPVYFNEKKKKFEECGLEDSIHLFEIAPENWYCILKNPEESGKHPQPRTANELPNLLIGKKVNITGPTSFALYPGQMSQVIEGHKLRSNQYLLVRVYDEESAKKNWSNSIIKINDNSDSEDTLFNNIKITELTLGKILVIKGTDVSFYIPPTGIEVLHTGYDTNDEDENYVRDAVTLERLEYCILKDEDGNRRYVHGPAVVFPEPTEMFISNGNRGYKFRAIELSLISGIYVKVVAEYTEMKDDGSKIIHPVGEELFITGNDQMIYYPRPEHAIITYENTVLHHAIAIPAGEGRYVMNRMTGEIKTVKGPSMYLPDPRFEVIVKRKLTPSQCRLWYPGNDAVYEYNTLLEEDANVSSNVSNGNSALPINIDQTHNMLEPGSLLNRSNKYTKPRTITLNNKYEGVVSIDVWTGYAINVISKTSENNRKVIIGPCTYIMEYDETLEILEMSTGTPKTTDNLIKTTYLRIDNNKISDIINAQTKDFVDINVKVSYLVNFLKEYSDRWFSVENYVKFLCDRLRSIMKKEIKKYSIEEFFQKSTDIVRNTILKISDDGTIPGRFFEENGMIISDVEILSIKIPEYIHDYMMNYQFDMIKKSIELYDAEDKVNIAKKLADNEKLIADIEYDKEDYKLKLKMKNAENKYAYDKQTEEFSNELSEIKSNNLISEERLKNDIENILLARETTRHDHQYDVARKNAELESYKQANYANAVKTIGEAISPQLAASIKYLANMDYVSGIAQAVSPMAIIHDESIADVANKLLKGTALEEVFNIMKDNH